MNGIIKHKRRIPSIFSATLYWVGIKRLSVIGLILSVTVFLPHSLYLTVQLIADFAHQIGRLFPALASIMAVFSHVSHSSWLQLPIIILENIINSSFYLPIVGVASVMTVFSFLNSRKGSDFYHSLSYSRLCIFNSFYAAVISWMLVFFIAPFLSHSVSGLIRVWFLSSLPGCVQYSYFFPRIWFMQSLGIFLLTLCTMSALLLAKSLTGTKVSNFVVTLILLCSVMMTVYLLISYFLHITTIMTYSEPYHNLEQFQYLYENLAFSVIALYENSEALTDTPIWIFGLCAAIYSILAAIAFCQRKSQTSGYATTSSFATHTICVLFVVPIIILFFYLDISAEITRPISFVLYVIPIILFFILELILQKSIVKTVKSFHVLIAPIAVSLCLILSVKTVSVVIEYNVPDTSQIQGVTVTHDVARDNSYDPLIIECNFEDFKEKEFFASCIKEYAKKPDYGRISYNATSTFNFKDGKSLEMPYYLDENSQNVYNCILDSYLCDTLLKTALDSEYYNTYKKSLDFTVTNCSATLCYLSNNLTVSRRKAPDEILQVISNEFSTMSPIERASLRSGDNISAYGPEGLNKNKYCVVIEFQIQLTDSGIGKMLSFNFPANQESYPMIHNAISEYLANNEISQ